MPIEERSSGSPYRDIILIGASVGGVDALTKLVSGLPRDLPAAIFVVLHVQPGFGSVLPELLTSSGLAAAHAIHGEPVVMGRIYVAPPDNHLMLRPGRLSVLRGPKENGHRPAVDALFRTASMAYGPRVIGVILTGNGDCGTAGMLSIKARGGVGIVQDPAEAVVPSMPRSALKHVRIDHVASVKEMPRLLAELTRQPTGEWPKSVQDEVSKMEGSQLGDPVGIVCPTCQGSLAHSQVNGFDVFRCHVGHSFSLASVLAEQADEVERALWAAARALEEAAVISQRLAQSSRADLRARFEEKYRTQLDQARAIRRFLLSGAPLTEAEGVVAETADVSQRPN